MVYTSILVIDDDRDLLESLKDCLGLMGYETECAEDGISGLEAAMRGAPDIIILDINLPGMSGWEVLRHLRESSVCCETPVIICSASREAAERFRKEMPENTSFIAKPFSYDEMEIMLNNCLEKKPPLECRR